MKLNIKLVSDESPNEGGRWEEVSIPDNLFDHEMPAMRRVSVWNYLDKLAPVGHYVVAYEVRK